MTRIITYVLACVAFLSVACQGLITDPLSLAAVGLVGLKLYLGMYLLAIGTSILRRQNSLISVPDQDKEDDKTTSTTTALPLDESIAAERKRTRRSVSSRLVPRGNGLPKLNVEMLEFIHEIDDDQCFEKFFCQIGANRKAFGNFGANVAILLDLYVPNRTAWYTKALAQGRKLRNKELCPGKCESEDIQRAVKFVSKHVFDEN